MGMYSWRALGGCEKEEEEAWDGVVAVMFDVDVDVDLDVEEGCWRLKFSCENFVDFWCADFFAGHVEEFSLLLRRVRSSTCDYDDDDPRRWRICCGGVGSCLIACLIVTGRVKLLRALLPDESRWGL